MSARHFSRQARSVASYAPSPSRFSRKLAIAKAVDCRGLNSKNFYIKMQLYSLDML